MDPLGSAARGLARQMPSTFGYIPLGGMNLSSKLIALCENCNQGERIKEEFVKQTDLFKNKGWSRMHSEKEINQFEVLEQKILSLIQLAKALKREKEGLSEKFKTQQEDLTNISKELEGLRSERGRSRQRMATIMERIKLVDLG